LVPPHYLTDGWKKTVGPYSVSSWSGLKELLRLKANPYSPLYSPDMPRSASLFFIPNLKTSFDLFKKIPVDIVAQSAIGNPELISNLRQSAGQEYVAHPTTIFFFYFNDRNTEARDIKNRQAFAQVIYDYQQQSKVLLEEKYGWNLETQMVPEGFTGRLTSLPTSSESGVALPKKVEITIPDYFKDFPLFYTGLTSAFAKHNVELKIRFGGRKIDGNESLAGIYLFVGNQLDPSGSWSFLMTPPYGMLAPWLNDVRASFDAVFSGEQMDIRPQKLEQLHSEVLKDYLAIPFAVGSTRYFLSPRVDASRWNRFDSRLRIYELRWK
jgi:hypothetical protein